MKKINLLLCAVLCMAIWSAALPSCFAAEQNTTMTVDEDNIIRPDPQYMLGYNNDSGWGSAFALADGVSDEKNTEFYQTLKTFGVNIPQIRGFFHDLNWKDTIGPANERGGNYYGIKYTFGMVEWIKAVLDVTPEAGFVLTVNVDDTAEDMADMARFLLLKPEDENATGQDGVNWARKRVEYGLTEPVNVVCFELGNETDLKSLDSTTGKFADGSQQEYIGKCSAIIAAMKAVGEAVKVSIVAASTPQGNTDWASWNEPVIAALGAKTDYVVCHYYFATSGNFGYWWDIDRLQNQILNYVNRLPEGSRPKVYPSEYAYYVSVDECATDQRTTATDLNAALLSGELVNRFVTNKSVGLASYHAFLGSVSTATEWVGSCWGMIRPYKTGEYILSAVGEYYKMASDAMKNAQGAVSVTLSQNNYTKSATSSNMNGNKILTATAYQRPDGGLNLLFVNTNPDISHNISFQANGQYILEKEVVLTADSTAYENLPEDADKVYAVTNAVSGNSLFSSYTVPAKSVVVLYLAPAYGSMSPGGAVQVSANNVILDDSTPQVPCTDGALDISCTIFANGPLNKATEFPLMILKGNTDVNHISKNDILYLNTACTVRNRAFLKVKMPENAENGAYILYAGDKSADADAYIARSFYYQNTKSENPLIQSITNISAANDDYAVCFIIGFAQELENTSRFSVRVQNEISNVVYIGEELKTADTQSFAFYMPKEAVSGEYTVTVGCDRNGKTDSLSQAFTFTKPKEKITLADAVRNQDGNTFAFADLNADGTMKLSLENITDSAVSFKVLVAVYNVEGRLISTYTGANCNDLPAGSKTVYEVPCRAKTGSEAVGAVIAYVWSQSNGALTMQPLTDFYIVKE